MQIRIYSNLLTLISGVRNSHIISAVVLQIFFSSCKFLARSTWNLLSFTPCPVLPHAKKTHPQEQRFPVLLLGKNRTTGAENPVPIDSKGQCCFNPKTDLQEKEHFFQCGEKLVRVELTMRLRRGEEKGGPVLLFEAKNRPTGREISAPPETLFITSWYITPSLFLVQTLERKKILTYKNQNFCFKTFTFSALLTHTSARPGIFKDSLNIFKFFNSQIFSSSYLLSLRFQISSEFKLFFFFRKRWKQEGIRRSRFTSQALNLIWNYAVH